MMQSFTIARRATTLRTIAIALFIVWGIGGFWQITEEIVAASRMQTLGIGTSGAVMMHTLYWIGGVIFFGVAALLTEPATTIETRSDSSFAPRHAATEGQEAAAISDYYSGSRQ